MPLETATYISGLNASNPAATDGLNNADDHLRLIKATLLATFPNINAALNITDEQLNQLALNVFLAGDGSSGAPAYSFASEATLGLYRSSTGHLKATGRLIGNGTVPAGSIFAFPKAPSSFGSTVGGLTVGGYEWLELDGTVYNISSYPDLGGYLLGTFGGNGTTTFAVPNVYDTGRFLRSRASTIGVGTYQANAFKQHNHAGSTVSGTTDSQGSHNHGGVTANDSPDHTHNITGASTDGKVGGVAAGSAGGNVWFGSVGATATTGASARHTHGIATDGAHTHSATNWALSIASEGLGNTETRPEAFGVIYAIKT